MLKGFKTKLDPNNEQRTKFAQHAGVARYTYNWGLDICHQAIDARKRALEKGEPLPKFPSAMDLHKKLNAEVKPELEWFYDSSKCAPQQALRDLDNARTSGSSKSKGVAHQGVKRSLSAMVFTWTVLFKLRTVLFNFLASG